MKRLITSATVIMILMYLLFAWYVWQIPDEPQIITCDERYIWDSYVWVIKWKDWDYIYLSWTHELDTICTPYEEEVDEETPLCWTKVPFEWPLDTSNMNCYYDNPRSKLKAFKKQAEAEKKEDKRYYTCKIITYDVVQMYNSCETSSCVTNRLRTYFQENCPRANIE